MCKANPRLSRERVNGRRPKKIHESVGLILVAVENVAQPVTTTASSPVSTAGTFFFLLVKLRTSAGAPKATSIKPRLIMIAGIFIALPNSVIRLHWVQLFESGMKREVNPRGECFHLEGIPNIGVFLRWKWCPAKA